MTKKQIKSTKESDIKEFFTALKLMAEEKGIPAEYIAAKISEAITVASRKDYGGNDVVVCTIDPEKEIFEVLLEMATKDATVGETQKVLADRFGLSEEEAKHCMISFALAAAITNVNF